ncbi:hypothetical protein ACFL1H_00785 [Nanoarchaeota archaeon]
MYKKIIIGFAMILLILNIVNAASFIQIESMEGVDNGIERVVANDENIMITVVVNLDNAPDGWTNDDYADNIYLKAPHTTERSFLEDGGSCTDHEDGGDKKRCTYEDVTFTDGWGEYAVNGKIIYDYIYITDGEDIFEKKESSDLDQLTVYVDEESPVFDVNYFEIDEINTETFDMKFRVSDYGNVDESCAGFSLVRVFVEGRPDIFLNTSLKARDYCKNDYFIIDDEFDIDSLIASGQTKVVSICYQLIDQLGNEAEDCFHDVFVDRESPDYIGLNVTQNGDDVINYLSAGLSEVNINAYFEDNSSIVAVLIGANELHASNSNNIPVSCSDNLGYENIKCTWTGIKIEISADLNQNIQINVTDSEGNNELINENLNLPIDASAPTITYFGSKYKKGDEFTLFNSEDNDDKKHQLKMVVQDQGIGISNPENVKIGFSSSDIDDYPLSCTSGNPVVCPAKDCNQSSSNTYVCIWEDFNFETVDDNHVIVTIESVQDDLGNFIEDYEYNNLIYFDQEVPEMGYIYYFEPFSNVRYIAKDNQIGFNIEVSDDVGISSYTEEWPYSYIDASSLGIENIIQLQCTNDTCVGESTAPITLEGNYDVDIYIADYTNKTAHNGSYEVNVLRDVGEDEDPGWYIDSSDDYLTTYPIDRQTSKNDNKNVYFDVPLKERHPQDLTTLDVSLEPGCVTGNSTEFISNDGYVVYSRGSRTPKVVFVMKESEFQVNNISLNCGLRIVSRSDTKLFDPYHVNVSFKIEFHDMPAGELSLNIKEAIDKEKEKRLESKLAEILEWMRKWDDICQIEGKLNKIQGTLNNVHSAVAAISVLFKASDKIVEASKKMCEGDNSYSKTVNNVAKHVHGFCSLRYCSFAGEDADQITQMDNVPEWAAGVHEQTALNPEGANNLNNALKNIPGIGELGPDSLVYNVATLCVPGILSKLNDYFSIRCKYVYCLETKVANGWPRQICENDKAFDECAFVFDELFNFVPYGNLIEEKVNTYKTVLAQPELAALIGGAGLIACGGKLNAECKGKIDNIINKCPIDCGKLGSLSDADLGKASSVCIRLTAINNIANLVNDYKGYKGMDTGSFFDVEEDQGNYCNLISSDEDE